MNTRTPDHPELYEANESVTCPQCQRHELESRHCKLICQACGYVESCEDNFPASPEKH